VLVQHDKHYDVTVRTVMSESRLDVVDATAKALREGAAMKRRHYKDATAVVTPLVATAFGALCSATRALINVAAEHGAGCAAEPAQRRFEQEELRRYWTRRTLFSFVRVQANVAAMWERRGRGDNIVYNSLRAAERIDAAPFVGQPVEFRVFSEQPSQLGHLV
jgi:hypothetical protein